MKISTTINVICDKKNKWSVELSPCTNGPEFEKEVAAKTIATAISYPIYIGYVNMPHGPTLKYAGGAPYEDYGVLTINMYTEQNLSSMKAFKNIKIDNEVSSIILSTYAVLRKIDIRISKDIPDKLYLQKIKTNKQMYNELLKIFEKAM